MYRTVDGRPKSVVSAQIFQRPINVKCTRTNRVTIERVVLSLLLINNTLRDGRSELKVKKKNPKLKGLLRHTTTVSSRVGADECLLFSTLFAPPPLSQNRLQSVATRNCHNSRSFLHLSPYHKSCPPPGLF